MIKEKVYPPFWGRYTFMVYIIFQNYSKFVIYSVTPVLKIAISR